MTVVGFHAETISAVEGVKFFFLIIGKLGIEGSHIFTKSLLKITLSLYAFFTGLNTGSMHMDKNL